MAHRKPSSQETLQVYLTEFAIEIGLPELPDGTIDKVRYNRAWLRLWKRIHRLRLFPKVAGD